MKKILAIVMALSMVLVFAACGKSGETETTATKAADDLATTAEKATEAVTDENGEAVTDENGDAVTELDKTDASNWTVEEIVAFYNEARANTSEDISNYQTMALYGDISGDGAIGTILKVLQPAAEKALAKNSKAGNGIPGRGSNDLLPEDVQTATASEKDGKVTINIVLKNQVDGSDGDSKNGGAVARGIGTLGSIDSALKELGAELTEGRNTVSLTYTNAYINCVVDKESKTITSGTYHYIVNVLIKDAKAKLGITAHLENLKAGIEYTVKVG